MCVYVPLNGSDHYATVVGERDELLQQKTESQRCYRTSMERGQEDNDKVGEWV